MFVVLLVVAPPAQQNGFNESFNGSLRDGLLNGEIFYSLAEARVLIKTWRRDYNTVRPHSSLGDRPPAPDAATPPLSASGSTSLHLRPADGDAAGEQNAARPVDPGWQQPDVLSAMLPSVAREFYDDDDAGERRNRHDREVDDDQPFHGFEAGL